MGRWRCPSSPLPEEVALATVSKGLPLSNNNCYLTIAVCAVVTVAGR